MVLSSRTAFIESAIIPFPPGYKKLGFQLISE